MDERERKKRLTKVFALLEKRTTDETPTENKKKSLAISEISNGILEMKLVS